MQWPLYCANTKARSHIPHLGTAGISDVQKMLLHGKGKADTGVVGVWNTECGRQQPMWKDIFLVKCEKLNKMLLA
jgi:hypothetical protein